VTAGVPRGSQCVICGRKVGLIFGPGSIVVCGNGQRCRNRRRRQDAPIYAARRGRRE